MSDPLYRENSGRTNHLDARKTRTVVSVQLPEGPNASLATLYAQLDGDVRAPTQVAVRLEAELLGTRQLVATAAIPPGYNGIVALATGIVADSWHGTAYGVLRRSQLELRLATRPCCSSFSVVVPATLTTRLVPRLASATPTATLPLVRDQGAFNCYAGVAGAVNLAGTERATRIVAISDVGGGNLAGLGMNPIAWPASTRVDFEPRGNCEGPRTLTFAGTTYYQVEIVH